MELQLPYGWVEKDRDRGRPTNLVYRVSQKHRKRFIRCAGRQTEHCSKRNSCPEMHGLGAVERQSLRRNGCHNLFRFVLCPITAGMQLFSHMRTLIVVCGITSTLHIQIDGLVEGDQFHGQHGHQIWHLSTISFGVVVSLTTHVLFSWCTVAGLKYTNHTRYYK